MSESLLFGLVLLVMLVFLGGLTAVNRRHRARRRAR